MKILSYMLSQLRIYLKMYPIYLFSLILFPVFLAVANGYMGQSPDSSQSPFRKNSLHIQNHDKGDLGKNLLHALEKPEFAPIIQLEKNKSTADFTLVIPSTYTQDSLKGTGQPLELQRNSTNASDVTGLAMAQIIKGLRSSLLLSEGVDQALSNSPSAKALLHQGIQRYDKGTLTFQRHVFPAPHTMNSYQRASVNSMGFMLFLILISSTMIIQNKAVLGFTKRVTSAPMSLVEIFGIGYVTDTLLYTSIFWVYIVGFRLIQFSFFGNILPYLLLSLGQVSVFVLIGFLFHQFVPKFLAQSISTIVFILSVLASSFSQDFTSNSIFFQFLQHFSINRWISTPYFQVMENPRLEILQPHLLQLLGLSAVLFLIGMTLRHLKKDVRL